MLVEFGSVSIEDREGRVWTFNPSFARIADLGSPEGIVTLFAELYGASASDSARYVLACMCDQDDATPLLGWLEPGEGTALTWCPGTMSAAQQVVIARHLMQHGIAGKARPGDVENEGDGQYADRFDAAEYVAAARVHLGMSRADAESLSMTEFQTMLELKFPEMNKNKKRDVPSREEYEAAMAMVEGRKKNV